MRLYLVIQGSILVPETKFQLSEKTNRVSNFNMSDLPIIKKFPGNTFSFKLLYVRSNISSTGKEPKPLGKLYSLFNETLRILNLGSDDKLTGSS